MGGGRRCERKEEEKEKEDEKGAGGMNDGTPTLAGGAGLMKSVCPVKVKINWRSGGGYRDNQPGPVVFKPTHRIVVLLSGDAIASTGSSVDRVDISRCRVSRGEGGVKSAVIGREFAAARMTLLRLQKNIPDRFCPNAQHRQKSIFGSTDRIGLDIAVMRLSLTIAKKRNSPTSAIFPQDITNCRLVHVPS